MKDTQEATPTWTLLTRHAHALLRLHARPRTTLRSLATYLDVTERSAQRIVAELEAEGLLAHRRVGRRNFYEVHLESPLRHPLEQGRRALEWIAPSLAETNGDGSKEGDR